MAVQNPTTNFNWTLPINGASIGTWGTLLNQLLGDDATGLDAILKTVKDTADGALPKTGGTLTGALTTAGLTIGGALAVNAAATFNDSANFNGVAGLTVMNNHRINGNLLMGATTVIDSGRNLNNVNISAGNVNSGVLHSDRIPGLVAGKITSGEFHINRIPTIPWSKVTSPSVLAQLGAPTDGFGSLSISGATGNYAGIDFAGVALNFMVAAEYQGIMDHTGDWKWRFYNGVFEEGWIPWSRLQDKPATFAPSAHSHIVVQSTQPAGVEGRIWVKP